MAYFFPPQWQVDYKMRLFCNGVSIEKEDGLPIWHMRSYLAKQIAMTFSSIIPIPKLQQRGRSM